MRILIISSTHNGMTQQIVTALADAGHEIAVALHGRAASRLAETAASFEPELIVGAALTRAVPEQVAREHFCVLIEPVMHRDGETCDVLLREAAPQLEARPILAMRRLPPLREIQRGHYREALAEQAVACLGEVIALLSEPGPQRSMDPQAAHI